MLIFSSEYAEPCVVESPIGRTFGALNFSDNDLNNVKLILFTCTYFQTSYLVGMDKCTQLGNSAVLWALSMSRLMVGKKQTNLFNVWNV